MVGYTVETRIWHNPTRNFIALDAVLADMVGTVCERKGNESL